MGNDRLSVSPFLSIQLFKCPYFSWIFLLVGVVGRWLEKQRGGEMQWRYQVSGVKTS